MDTTLLRGVPPLEVEARLVEVVAAAVVGEAIIIADSRGRGSDLREKGMGGAKLQNQRF